MGGPANASMQMQSPNRNVYCRHFYIYINCLCSIVSNSGKWRCPAFQDNSGAAKVSVFLLSAAGSLLLCRHPPMQMLNYSTYFIELHSNISRDIYHFVLIFKCIKCSTVVHRQPDQTWSDGHHASASM